MLALKAIHNLDKKHWEIEVMVLLVIKHILKGQNKILDWNIN